MLFIGGSLACRQAPHRTQGHPFAYSPTQSSIDLIDAAAKGRPFSFRKPCSANSAEIAEDRRGGEGVGRNAAVLAVLVAATLFMIVELLQRTS
jgi:hypothetical protein